MRKRPDYSYEQWRLMPHLVTFPGGVEKINYYNKFFIANASIVVIESDRAFLRTLNDTCHIKNLITAKS